MSGYAMPPPRETRLPALVAAIALHAGVLALVLLAPSHLPQPVGSSVPINIVSSAPFTDTRQAVQAPQTQSAATPEPAPAPQAPPQPPAPVPAPPSFTEPAPATPKVAKPTAKPQPALSQHAQTAAQPLDLNRLQQIIASHRAGGQPATSAPKGPARVETAPEDRPSVGQGISESDMLGLQQLLQRLWNPNCDVAGGASVKLQVHFRVGIAGAVLGQPVVSGGSRPGDPVVAAATRRALDAVQEAAPYQAPYYGQTITVNFDAKEACAKR